MTLWFLSWYKQSFNETEIEFMLANVRQIWQRFLYRDSVLLEAQRQKRLFAEEEDWAVEFSKLEEDDVFSTFIQVNAYSFSQGIKPSLFLERS